MAWGRNDLPISEISTMCQMVAFAMHFMRTVDTAFGVGHYEQCMT